jgi:hypothetical protein
MRRCLRACLRISFGVVRESVYRFAKLGSIDFDVFHLLSLERARVDQPTIWWCISDHALPVKTAR